MEYTRADGTMGFTPEEIADGKLNRFLSCLLELGCEIRIHSDGYCQIVEYISCPECDSVHFALVGDNEYVATYSDETDD